MVQYPRWQVILVVVVLLLGAAFAAPNLLSRDTAGSLPDWIPREQINLGLDLQGGSYLLMEVDFDTVVRERLDTLVDSVRTELRKARILDQDHVGRAIGGQLPADAAEVRANGKCDERPAVAGSEVACCRDDFERVLLEMTLVLLDVCKNLHTNMDARQMC